MLKGIDWLARGLEVLLVILLAGMAIMVFGNVVLRYGFNSGILVSEEMSRYFFVWLTFIGAVVTFRENAHLGVESLVQRFGRNGRLICMVLSDLIILLCMAAFFWGTWKQYPINASMTAPVVGISMNWIYGIGFFTAVGIGGLVIIRLLRTITGRITEDEINAFAGEGAEAAAIRERAE
ncbi:TRAP transporter small permease [Allomesorhizobium camelthorni]|uniref:TRAP transporter small permease protein n=1 Tax=Allomesorhizobium camelthorni TaxID=475069 RepID=A0A6G4WEP5_9HYPH|nr:TRAP transporter small permease [Mesorhizobium camelthorni]NGO53079.1 TRAP transporter small permease [Mesorhizobium camelthorni]